MDQAITDASLEQQCDFGATAGLDAKSHRDQVSFAVRMASRCIRYPGMLISLKGNADSSASDSEYQHALEVLTPINLPGCLS